MTTTHSRFFSDFYDSVNQRLYPDICRIGENAKELYIGRLRFDTILSNSLVLTDAQILDGQFFHDVEPNALKRTIAHSDDTGPMPIEIRSRSESLEEALLLFFKQPGRSKLRGFLLSVVQNEEGRLAIKEELEKTNADKVKSWRDILKILKSIGVPDEDRTRIESGWTHWFEAQKKGLIRVVRWSGSFMIDQALDSKDILDNLHTSDEKLLIKWIEENRTDRSAVDKRLTELRAECTSDDLALDLKEIDAWYHEAYNRALAWQHNCENFESISSSPASMRMYEEDNIGRLKVKPEFALDLPSEFLLKLGKMPDETFKRLFWQSEENLTQWWNNGDEDALKRAISTYTATISNSKEKELPLKDRLMTKVVGGSASVTIASEALRDLSNLGTGADIKAEAIKIVIKLAPIIGMLLSEVLQYWKIETQPSRRIAKQTLQRIMQIANERKSDEAH